MLSCSSDGDKIGRLVEEAFQCDTAKNYTAALDKLLEAENLMDDDTPLELRERLERVRGWVYYHLNMYPEMRLHTAKALEYAREMNDTNLIATNLYNSAHVADTLYKGIRMHLELEEMLRDKESNIKYEIYHKLAQSYINCGDLESAKKYLDIFDSIYPNKGSFASALYYTALDSLDKAYSIYYGMDHNKLDLQGKHARILYIYHILLQQEKYKEALAYADSLHVYSDSLSSTANRRLAAEVESDFTRRLEDEKRRGDIILSASLGLLAAALLVIVLTVKNLNLKKHRLALSEKLAELNVELARLQPGDDDSESSLPDIDPALAIVQQKFALSLDIFKAKPQYSLLKKLNLLHNPTAESRDDIARLKDAMTGTFADSCSDLRQLIPSMTADDCLFCAYALCGCRYALMSAMTGSSEDALRRRKSRIKQKLPEQVFTFFFT